MLAKVSLSVADPDVATEVKAMNLNSVEGKTCVWCVAVTTLEEKITGLKSVVGKSCILCVAAAMAALALLAVTWTVILVSS